MVTRRLRPIPIFPVAAPAYLDRNGRPTDPRELERHACFAYSNAPRPDRWQLVDGQGRDCTIRPTSTLAINSGEAMLPALRAGLGVALLPEFIVAADLAERRLERVLPGWSAPPVALHLLMPSAGPRPARVSAVIAFLVARFGEYVRTDT